MPTSRPKLPVPLEFVEQSLLVQCARAHEVRYPALRWLFAVPNAAKRTRWERGRALAEGMRAGVPDLWMPYRIGDCPGVVIEMKRTEGGVVSPEQREWIDHLVSQQWRAVVCKGAVEGWRQLCTYLGLPDHVRLALKP